MVHVELEDDGITVVTERRDMDLIRALPGARYDVQRHRWRAPVSWGTCVTLRGLFGDRLEIGPALLDWAKRERSTRVEPALALRGVIDAPGDPDLYPFQRAGVQFLTRAKRALLCDEMGTGKTVQIIRTLVNIVREGDNPFPCIVVSPNNMKITWRREFERWYPGVQVVVIDGGIAARKKQLSTPAHVYVVNYEGLRAHSRLAPYGSIRQKRCWNCDPTFNEGDKAGNPRSCEHCKKELNLIAWRTVVVDEAHKMKDARAKQTRACWALVTPETEYRFALTGTAIANNPADLWPALRFISPEEWPSRRAYINRYCVANFNVWGGMNVVGLEPRTRDEFFSVVDPRMRRMPKDAVLPHLPPKTYSKRYVEMSPKQAKAYAQMEETLIAALDDAVTVAVNPLVQLTRLTQFASAYASLDENGEVRLESPSCKIDALVEILEELGEEPVVVFAQSRQLIELAAVKLAELKIQFGKIVGGQTGPEREAEKEAFQQGRLRAMLCTISAGGVGITLTRASTAVFLQRSWSMVDNKQAEDRVHRIGSEVHDKITIVDVIAVNTLEERQRLVLGDKEERLEEVMRDRALLRQLLASDKTAKKGRKA